MEDNFKKLRTYFENLKEEEIIQWKENSPFIDMSYLFSETIDRETLKKVLATILAEYYSKYEYYSAKARKDPEEIEGFRVKRDPDRLILQAIGADGYARLNITDTPLKTDKIQGVPVPTISLEELEERIAEELDRQRITQNAEILKLTPAMKNTYFQKQKEVAPYHKDHLAIAKAGLNQFFGNLEKYYKYLVEYSNFLQTGKEDELEKSLMIHQRKDMTKERTGKGNKIKPRKNEVIDFMQRKEILDSFNPTNLVRMWEQMEDGEIVANSYTVFTYTNALEATVQQQEGWLFVCEPIRGNRATRLMYLTREEFEKFPIGESNNRIASIAKNYLDMSQSEFTETAGTLILNHTTLDNYIDKMSFFIEGNRSRGNITKLIANMRNLYKDKTITPSYYRARKPSDIAKIAEAVPISKVDRTAQEATVMQDKEAKKPEINE